MRGKLFGMSTENRNLCIGFMALVLVIGGIFFAVAGQKSEAARHTYHAVFRTVEGVKIGAPVYVFGIQVGKVSHMQLSDGQVKVSVTVDATVPIPIDSSLEVQTAGLFAEKSMTVLLGFEEDILQDKNDFMYAGNAVDVMGLLNQQLDINMEKRKAESNGS